MRPMIRQHVMEYTCLNNNSNYCGFPVIVDRTFPLLPDSQIGASEKRKKQEEKNQRLP